jgi:hypothetical protein
MFCTEQSALIPQQWNNLFLGPGWPNVIMKIFIWRRKSYFSQALKYGIGTALGWLCSDWYIASNSVQAIWLVEKSLHEATGRDKKIKFLQIRILMLLWNAKHIIWWTTKTTFLSIWKIVSSMITLAVGNMNDAFCLVASTWLHWYFL